MARTVLRPLLEVLDALSPALGADLRAKLIESRDHAEQTLGGGR
jgi:ATP phosphoribosyltransferase regulatory subunit HisZ